MQLQPHQSILTSAHAFGSNGGIATGAFDAPGLTLKDGSHGVVGVLTT
jgi:hypothetical protein